MVKEAIEDWGRKKQVPAQIEFLSNYKVSIFKSKFRFFLLLYLGHRNE